MFKLFVLALKGAGAFRFYLQPIMAIIRGIKHGRQDAKQGVKPVISRLFVEKEKFKTLKQLMLDVLPVTIIALIIDLYAQWHIFEYIYVVMTLLVILLIVFVPYIASRDIANRLYVPVKKHKLAQ